MTAWSRRRPARALTHMKKRRRIFSRAAFEATKTVVVRSALANERRRKDRNFRFPEIPAEAKHHILRGDGAELERRRIDHRDAVEGVRQAGGRGAEVDVAVGELE